MKLSALLFACVIFGMSTSAMGGHHADISIRTRLSNVFHSVGGVCGHYHHHYHCCCPCPDPQPAPDPDPPAPPAPTPDPDPQTRINIDVDVDDDGEPRIFPRRTRVVVRSVDRPRILAGLARLIAQRRHASRVAVRVVNR